MGNDPRRGKTRAFSALTGTDSLWGEGDMEKRIVCNVNGAGSSRWRLPASDALGPTSGLAVNISGFAGLNVTHNIKCDSPWQKGKFSFFFLHLTLKNVKSIPSLEPVRKAGSGPGVAPGPQFANP